MKALIAGTALCISLLATNVLPAAAGYEAGVNYYRQGKYTEAIDEFRADGSAQSIFYLSLMYEMGDGTPQNREHSLAMLQLAAEKGLDVAQASLGMMYLEGRGVEADEQKGFMWLSKAARQGLEEAEQALRLPASAQP